MILDSQLMVGDETTPGTAVTPSRGFEIHDESIEADFGRTESESWRAGQRVQRSDRYTPYMAGAAGDINLEVLTKGFGFWLKHMLGSVATAAGAAGETNLFTGTIGPLDGKSFTAQVGRATNPGGVVTPYTYAGGKVAKWKLSNSVEKNLMLALSCDFFSEDTAQALAAASYPTNANPYTWVGGLVTIGGTNVDVMDISLSCDNGLKTDRRRIRRNALKREQIENGPRMPEFDISLDFLNTTQRDRVASLIRANNLATLVASWQGPIQEGTTTTPIITVTMPAARFDKHTVAVGGPESLESSIGGRGLFDGAQSAITVSIATLDATP